MFYISHVHQIYFRFYHLLFCVVVLGFIFSDAVITIFHNALKVLLYC